MLPKDRPNVCHGKPVVSGTRVLVATVLGALSGGDTFDQILEDYPSLTRADIEAALEFAAEAANYQIFEYEAVA